MYYLTTTTNVDTLMQAPDINTQAWLNAIYTNQEPIVTAPVREVPHPHTENFCRVRTTTFTEPKTNTLPREVLHQLILKLDTLTTSIQQIPDSELTYTTFHIPKNSGGYREINAPDETLKQLQYKLVELLMMFKIPAHDCAYAYVEHRCCKDALVEHQRNNSKWFLKLDLKHFFNNCTPEFVTAQLQKLNNIAAYPETNRYLFTCLNRIAYLNNGLPQGTPISPMLTNLIMIPIDHALANFFHNRAERNFVYTRYADDLLISSKYAFNYSEIITFINKTFEEFNAPFTINNDKTRYGSSAGSNWNLGLMLNKDNNITLGHKQTQRTRAAINNFLKDFTTPNRWSIIDTQVLLGNVSYFKSINLSYAEFVIKRLEDKYNLKFMDCCKAILN